MKDQTWAHEALRIVQVNMQVVDTPVTDPAEIMRQLKHDLHANAVVFNAAGIYAWYPSEVPGHFVNPFMEGRDLLGEALEAAHRLDMRFIARVDFTKADDSIYHQHPDWFVKDVDGQPVAIGEPRYGPWSLLYATCTNGPYCGEAVAFPVMEELLAKYDVDGLFYNGARYRTCHCANCQNQYRALYGEELPSDPELFPAEWRDKSFFDNMKEIYRISKAVRPDVLWLGSFGLGAWRDASKLMEYADIPCSEPLDYFAGGYEQRRPNWWSGMTSNLGRAISGGVPPIVIIHACTGMTTRHVTLPQPESRFWLAQVVAHGGNIWHTLTGIPNTQYDQRILDGVAEFNALAERHADALTDLEPVAPVGIVFSRDSLAHGGQEELFGFVEAFVNHQVPFTFLLAEELTAEKLGAFDVVVLPNVVRLSDEAIAALQSYQLDGGGIVASYETSLYDEQGDSRQTLGLGDALEVAFAGHRLRNQVTSYMRVEMPDHPLTEEIGPTQFIMNGLDMLQVTTEAKVPLTLVPPFAVPSAAGSPPERASIPTKRTDIPLAVVGSRSVYFPGEIGRLAWTFRQPDHQDLIVNAVRAVSLRPFPISVEGPHSLQAALYKQGEDYVLHLVNATGDRPHQDTIPLRDVRITVRGGEGARRADALVGGTELERSSLSGSEIFIIPEIEEWEIVRIKTPQA